MATTNNKRASDVPIQRADGSSLWSVKKVRRRVAGGEKDQRKNFRMVDIMTRKILKKN